MDFLKTEVELVRLGFIRVWGEGIYVHRLDKDREHPVPTPMSTVSRKDPHVLERNRKYNDYLLARARAITLLYQ